MSKRSLIPLALALIIVASMQALINGSAASLSSSDVAIYYLPEVVNSSHLAIINSSLALITSNSGGSYIHRVVIPLEPARSILEQVVLESYVLTGGVKYIAKSSSLNPLFVALATNQGEVILMNTSSGELKPALMRFHASPGVDGISISSSGVALVQSINSLKALRYGSEGWCEISPAIDLGNATTGLSGVKVIGYSMAFRSTPIGYEYIPTTAIAFIEEPIPTLDSVVLNVTTALYNSTTGSIAIQPGSVVRVKFDNMSRVVATDGGRASIKVPASVNVLIEAFYQDPVSLMTYYGNASISASILQQYLGRYLPITVIMFESILIEPIPQPVTPVYIRVIDLLNPLNCTRSFTNPLLELVINTTNPLLTQVHSLYLSGSEATLVISYVDQFKQSIIEVRAVDIVSKALKQRSYRVIEAQVAKSSMSSDGRVLAVALGNNILYLYARQATGYYTIVDSYKLPGSPTSISIVSTRAVNGYSVLIGDYSGNALILIYGPGSGVKPLNRLNELALNIGSAPSYVDSLEDLGLVAISTPLTVLYTRDLGSIASRVGVDLSNYIARQLFIKASVRGIASESRVAIGGSESSSYRTRRGNLTLINLGLGNYSILIEPDDRYAPRASMNIEVGVSGVGLELSLIDFFTNSSIPLDASVYVGGELYDSITNVLSPRVYLPYGAKYNVTMDARAISISGYSLKAYGSASLVIDLTNKLSIYIEYSVDRRIHADRASICIYAEDSEVVKGVQLSMTGFSTNYTVSPVVEHTGCLVASKIPLDLYLVRVLSAPEVVDLPKEFTVLIDSKNYTHVGTYSYKPINLTIDFAEPLLTDVEVYVNGSLYVARAGSRTMSIARLKPGLYSLFINSTPVSIEGVKASIYLPKAFTVNAVNLTNYVLLRLDRGISKTLTICLLSEEGYRITDTNVLIVGLTSGEEFSLAIDPESKCFYARGVPYDVYRVAFTVESAYVNLTEKVVAVDRDEVAVDFYFPYWPLSVLIEFPEPLVVDAYVELGELRLYAPAGSSGVLFERVSPGTYMLRVLPQPTLPSFNTTISYYKDYLATVFISGLLNFTTLSVPLEPLYREITILFEDATLGGLVVDDLVLLINDIPVGTIRAGTINVTGYIPLGEFKLSIRSARGIYSNYTREFEGASLGNIIRVPLTRVTVPITVLTYSNLGDALSSVTIVALCIPYSTGALSIDGRAEIMLPIESMCYIEASLPGYSTVGQSIYVAKADSVTLVLSASLIMILQRFLPIIVAVIIVASVGVIVIYMRRKLIERMREAAAEVPI
ncbi:MAG: hypothetical protein RMI83_00020 [Desulfurococcaceae archaeon]|nr:hypothetical protein [Sulfolobales archaeon]MDW8169487.1 hypothetical protein [Desulfurococcaceae archaeon]